MSKLHLPRHKATAAARGVSVVGNPEKMVRQVPSVPVVAVVAHVWWRHGRWLALCPARTAQPDMTIVKCEYLSPTQHPPHPATSRQSFIGVTLITSTASQTHLVKRH